jgi:vacuolar protein sorting-associated protein 13A/C
MQVEDVSLTVGVGGNIGSEIFEKARGIGLVVRRPLRDLWHKLPVIEATVKVIRLKIFCLSSYPLNIRCCFNYL